jgi:predicted nucleotidyltransferase
MTTLPKDFKEFIELLNKNNAKYIVIGGYAVVYHGYVRSTNDIDIWIDIRKDNIKKVIKALDQFGFSSLGIKEADFSPNQIIQLGYPPNRIDLITTPAGIDFETCYESKEQVTIDHISVNIIDFENLIKSKKASNRTRDLADIEELT